MRLSNPLMLLDHWMQPREPPLVGLPELRSAAVLAHGVGATDVRDQALERLLAAADLHPRWADGRWYVNQVREWMAGRLGS